MFPFCKHHAGNNGDRTRNGNRRNVFPKRDNGGNNRHHRNRINVIACEDSPYFFENLVPHEVSAQRREHRKAKEIERDDRFCKILPWYRLFRLRKHYKNRRKRPVKEHLASHEQRRIYSIEFAKNQRINSPHACRAKSKQITHGRKF